MIPIAKPFIGEEERQAVADVLASGMLASGARTQEFERAFATVAGAAHCLAVNSGTAALHLAMLAAGVRPGDEVITSPFSFVATANTILMCGAKPVFADIDPATFNIDPREVEKLVTQRTKAILPVHLFGLSADMAPIMELARGRGLKVIEDACQAHGASYHGKPVGGIGDAGTFSFYPTKNMTTAEGGAVTTNDETIAAEVNSLRNHGRAPHAALGTYDHVQLGYNYRTSDVHSAIGLAQLRRLADFNSKRRANAQALTARLSGKVATPVSPPGCTHVFHQYTIRVPDRAKFIASMKAKAVGTGVYYPRSLYDYPHLGSFARACAHSQQAAREVVALPVHPLLSKADIETVADAVEASL